MESPTNVSPSAVANSGNRSSKISSKRRRPPDDSLSHTLCNPEAASHVSKYRLTLLGLAILSLTVLLSQYLIPVVVVPEYFLGPPTGGVHPAQSGLRQSKEQFLMKNEEQQNQEQVRPQKRVESEETAQGKRPQYHVVFSTSCTLQQHWESMVLFYHAMKVKQRGTVTRIVSGCKPDQADELQQFHDKYISKMSPDFHVHFTPNFANLPEAKGWGDEYKYMNKPFGLRHWMEVGLGVGGADTPPDLLDGIVFLLDPDMILLRPITHDFSDKDNHIFVVDNPATTVVKHGYPMSQQDGYLDSEWMGFDIEHITNRTDIRRPSPTERSEGPKFWNTGPPYLATVKDMYDIVVLWTQYAPRVLSKYPVLFAEMYGYIHATYQLNLPHTLIKSIVVSDHESSREGWAFIDALPNDHVCDPPQDAKLPIGLHYCSRYFIGRHFFNKYRVKKNIMNCDKALLVPTPHDLFEHFDYAIRPPRADGKDKETYTEEKSRERIPGKKYAKRQNYMVCALTSAMNEALRYLKDLACEPGTANLNETYSVHDDPSDYR